jgi:flagellar basal-body rod modification protein FlgD
VGASSQVSQTDFLRLLTEQLKQQDPTNPADPSQMAAQMAQFASSSGISEMNSSLKLIATQIADQTALLQSIQAATASTAAQVATTTTKGA